MQEGREEGSGAQGVVGIDLGTTYSVIARPGNGTVEILPVDGDRLCPSVVGYDDAEGWVVGQRALHRAVFDAEGTVRSVKRAMGSESIYCLGGQAVTPEQVSARILGWLVDSAERSLGWRPIRAVVTIPAYFNQAQRQATRQAGELAGLEVLRLLHEPTAAALAHRPDGGTRQILVYDLGGGTFDVSLVRQDGALLEVVSSHGDTRLGGDDFDFRLAERILYVHTRGDEVRAEAIRRSPTSWLRLLLEAESAKRRLSTEVETVARVEFLEVNGGRAEHLEVPVTRSLFESVVQDLLRKTQASIDAVLADARSTIADVDEVLLVGGSTRMPSVWHLIQDAYGQEPSRAVHPEESVAIGAAIEAGLMAGVRTGRVLVDVCPFSLGTAALVEEAPGRRHMICRTITPRNSPIPSRHVERFLAMSADQERVRAYFFQGGHLDPLENQCVGSAELAGIKRRRSEPVPTIHIAFEYNLDGVVEVSLADGAGLARTAGRFRTDRTSAAALLAEYLEHCRQAGVLPGPGREGFEVPAADPDAPAEGVQAPLSELRASVETIAGRLEELTLRYPERAAELSRAVTAARTALSEPVSDLGAAVEAHAQLADLVFDLGEFM